MIQDFKRFLIQTRSIQSKTSVLFWARTGWVIYYKRIERGTFRAPTHRGLGEVEAAELMLILEGDRSRWRGRLAKGEHDGVVSHSPRHSRIGQ